MAESFPERRKLPHLPLREQPNRSAIVLITVCTARRRHLLANPEVATLLTDIWRQTESWLIGRFVLLPDHLHAFCTPASANAPSLAQWVKYWKALAARRWPRPDERPIWQQGFWDRQLRGGEHYSRRWVYVRANPMRHGWAQDAEAWPYQGEINVFRFHDR
jgi:REP element-mobilizing transposase RayT